MSVLTITKDNFMTEVFDSQVPVLLDFWAEWCGPCQMTSPLIDEIAAEHPEIKVGKVNVDQERELATMFKVYSIPALFVVKDGAVTNGAVGAIPKDQIEALFK